MTERLTRLQGRIGDELLVIPPGSTMYYLTGVDAEQTDRPFFLAVAEDDAFFIAPELEAPTITDASDLPVHTYTDATDPYALVADTMPLIDTIRVGDTLHAQFLLGLGEQFPEKEFYSATPRTGTLRAVKEDEEIATIREAQQITAEIMSEVRTWDLVGRTEADIAERITEEIEERSDGVAFDPIVAAGPHAANPHHRHSDREIGKEPVVIDIGCRLDHYHSDMTRTVHPGIADYRFQEVFAIVSEAQEAAINVVEPGTTAAAVDAAAREVIERSGYGDAFIHRTGHGIGLDIHEPPFIRQDNEEVLEPGMVFSIEPGIYLEDRFGVRIEDVVLVTADGCEVLSPADHDHDI